MQVQQHKVKGYDLTGMETDLKLTGVSRAATVKHPEEWKTRLDHNWHKDTCIQYNTKKN